MEAEWYHKFAHLLSTKDARMKQKFSLLYKISGQDSNCLNLNLASGMHPSTNLSWLEWSSYSKKMAAGNQFNSNGWREGWYPEKVRWTDTLIDFHYVCIWILALPITSCWPRACYVISLRYSLLFYQKKII